MTLSSKLFLFLLHTFPCGVASIRLLEELFDYDYNEQEPSETRAAPLTAEELEVLECFLHEAKALSDAARRSQSLSMPAQTVEALYKLVGDDYSSRWNMLIVEFQNAGDDIFAKRDIAQRGFQMLVTAVNYVGSDDSAESDPEFEAKKCGEITSELWKHLYGEKQDPEQGEGKCIVQGDMMSGPQDCPSKAHSLLELAAASGSRTNPNIEKWPDPGSIPYCFAEDIHATSKEAFQKAVLQVEQVVPCIKFRQVKGWGRSSNGNEVGRCDVDDERGSAIFVQSFPNRRCVSFVGRMPSGATRVQLSPAGCDNVGIAVHELGHALGLLHEQSRPDRDQYVTILWDNIKPRLAYNFEMQKACSDFRTSAACPPDCLWTGTTCHDFTDHTSYDYLSIMHYSETEFGKVKNGQQLKTIEIVGHDAQIKVGQRMGLTSADGRLLAKMYDDHSNRCSDVQEVCSASPARCSNNASCVCHGDTADRNSQWPASVRGETLPGSGCYSCYEVCKRRPSCSVDPDCRCPLPSQWHEAILAGGRGACYLCEGNPPPKSATPPAPPPPTRQKQKAKGNSSNKKGGRQCTKDKRHCTRGICACPSGFRKTQAPGYSAPCFYCRSCGMAGWRCWR